MLPQRLRPAVCGPNSLIRMTAVPGSGPPRFLRKPLQTRFAELHEQARLTMASVCVVICDLDYFKPVNDSYGHDRGDSVLRDAAYAMRQSLRSFELIYRMGGEEFMIVLPDADLDEGLEVSERLRLAVEQCRPGGLDITASFGVSAAHGGGVDYESLTKEADRALYEAKRSGRNAVRAFDGGGTEETSRRMEAAFAAGEEAQRVA